MEEKKEVFQAHVDTSIYVTPEKVVDGLFSLKDAHKKLFYGNPDVDYKIELDGVLLSTESSREDILNNYYNNVLESEEKRNANLTDTRFRNVKCAILNLRSAVDHYDMSKNTEEDQDLLLKRIMVNMQRSYNMLYQGGIGVDFDFHNYLKVLCEIGKLVESEVARGRMINNELSEEAVMYIEQVKNSSAGNEKEALQNICAPNEEGGSMIQQWMNDYLEAQNKKEQNKR